MVRWMCGVKLKDRLPSKELRETLGVDDTALILQQNRLRWYGHVLRKDDDDWVKKYQDGCEWVNVSSGTGLPWVVPDKRPLNSCVCVCVNIYCCLQCFDAVGWAAGRASGL